MNKNVLYNTRCKINSDFNDGEALYIETNYVDNEDPNDDDVILNQKVVLHSYTNEASFSLYGAVLTPNKLRELANVIERDMIKAEDIKRKKYEYF
jgi:hypothetical protein